MALSLDQVKKKKTAAKVKASKETSRSQIRPWSQRGLAKEGKSPKQRVSTDSHMNEDWINLQEAPLFWIDLSRENRLASIEDKLLELEAKAIRFLRQPRRLAQLARQRLRALVF